MMHPEIKKQWVAALRSGEYEQGKARLHRGEEFCCLGVLCDLYRKEFADDDLNWEVNHWDYTFTFAGEDIELPNEVRDWAGLNSCDPGIVGDGVHGCSLSTLNDGYEQEEIEPHNFEEIADLIEENL